MNESINLSAFPKDSAQALAMVYLNTLDLANLTPEKIANIYNEAYEKIVAEQEKIKERANGSSTEEWLNTN